LPADANRLGAAARHLALDVDTGPISVATIVPPALLGAFVTTTVATSGTDLGTFAAVGTIVTVVAFVVS
jgi:hypothetical protein